jgi:hypothetical protein
MLAIESVRYDSYLRVSEQDKWVSQYYTESLVLRYADVNTYPQFTTPQWTVPTMVPWTSTNHELSREKDIHQEIVYQNSTLRSESGFSSNIVHHVHMQSTATGVTTMQKKISKALSTVSSISATIKGMF